MAGNRYHLLEAVSAQLEERTPGSLRAAKSRWKLGNTDIAQRIAGTSDKSAPEYRNALRRIRYAEKRGGITAEIRAVLESEARTRGWKRLRRHGTAVFVVTKGTYQVSSRVFKVGKYMRFGSDKPIGGARFDGVVREMAEAELAHLTGDSAGADAALERANSELEEVLSEAYGMDGGSVAHFTSVEGMDFKLR
jgi:hypothetical protein